MNRIEKKVLLNKQKEAKISFEKKQLAAQNLNVKFIENNSGMSYEKWAELNNIDAKDKKITVLNKNVIIVKNKMIQDRIKTNNKNKKLSFSEKISRYKEYKLKQYHVELDVFRHLDDFLSSFISNLHYFRYIRINSVELSNDFFIMDKKEHVDIMVNWLSGYPVFEIMLKNRITYPAIVLLFLTRFYWINDFKDLKFKKRNSFHEILLKILKVTLVKYEIPVEFYNVLLKYKAMAGYINMEQRTKLFFDMANGIPFHKKWDEYSLLKGKPSLTNKQIWYLNHISDSFRTESSTYVDMIFIAKMQDLKIDSYLINLFKEEFGREDCAINNTGDFDRLQQYFFEFIVFVNRNINNFNKTVSYELWDYVKRGIMPNRTGDAKGFFSNKSITTFYDDMLVWHAELNSNEQYSRMAWNPHPYIQKFSDEFYINIKTVNGFEKKIVGRVDLFELTSSSELKDEGSKMKHCVASYARDCSKGNCRIFTLRKDDLIGNIVNIGTIELRGDRVVQIKGKYNGELDSQYMAIIKKWAELNDLKLKGSFLL